MMNDNMDLPLDAPDLQAESESSTEPTGSLILRFDHVTAAEVRTILAGALKESDALYYINYMMDNESENGNG